MRFEVVVAAHALRHPDRLAVVTHDRRLTFSELVQGYRRIAAGLARMGVTAGDRVAIYLPNCVEYIKTLFGCLALGAVAVPVSTWLTPKELHFCCKDSKAKAVIFGRDHAKAVVNALADLAIEQIVVGDRSPGVTPFDELASSEISALPEIPTDQDECLLLYTSGTTGRSKGVIITHANVIMTGLVNGADWNVSAQDRYLVATPLANRTGIGRIINSMTLGGTLFVMGSFDPENWIEIVEREAITVVGSVPTMWRRILPHLETAPARCASLRVVLVTGEAFPPELSRRLMDALPQASVISFFGMTEVGAVTKLEGHEHLSHPKSVGRPVPGVEIKIIDARGNPVETGTVGELLVRTGTPGAFLTMKGYLNRPEINTEVLTQGWFHTGDLGYEDPDGYVYVVDRKKDMIVSGGFNIYSKEVENVVNQCRGVVDSAVVSVPDPDFGEAVVAFIESKGNGPTENEIIAHCRVSLASYKKPRRIFFVDSLPRNSIGKVLKQQLIEIAKAKLKKL